MDYKIFNKNYKYPQAKMDPVPYYDPSQKDVDVKWESGPLFVHDTQKIKDTVKIILNKIKFPKIFY